ncbi:MAG: M13 family metallopeptidase [Bacteroidota bacterium]
MKNKYILLTTIICGLFFFIPPASAAGNKTPDGIDPNNFDAAIKAHDNFYLYANGGWLKNNPVPSTEGRWGSFSIIQEGNLHKLRTLLAEAGQQTSAPGSNKQKMGDYYFASMDSVKKNKEGLKPLLPMLGEVEACKTNADIVALLPLLQVRGVRAVWSLYVSADPKASSQNITQAGQGGLGMPDREYYFKKDADSKSVQEAYLAHLKKLFVMMGDKPADAETHANLVMETETMLASASMTNVELRDIEKQYNKFTIAELEQKYPNSRWRSYLDALGLKQASNLIMAQPLFFAKTDSLFKSLPTGHWIQYLRWNVINSFADQLHDELSQANFDFYRTVLYGQKKMKPRWKRTIQEIDGTLGEALGQLFVEKYFTSESKKRVSELVDNLVTAYRERIDALDWMSPETKAMAQKKLNTVIRKLGYPDTWRDYSAMKIGRESHLQNYISAYRFELQRNYNKLGKPVDKTEWFMTPPTVNAYYNPTTNEITFPAGIMQPPFFFPDGDDAVNYAGIGAVIGHELTHGFDDQGSQFDEEGNMKNWWTDKDKEAFTARTQVLVKQFNNYVAIDSMHINGELTLGENIADLGGMAIAYAAFKKTAQGKSEERILGFTPDQRFFLSWAQIWRTNYTPAALKHQVNTNPHSPGMFRANGPLSNMPEFYKAFEVKPGTPMWRNENERAKIW